jgi:hypothetical protein
VIANHIHDALAQVRKLREIVLEKKLFKGYSGKARIVSGIAPLAAAVVLSSGAVSPTPLAHLAGWGVVLGVGLIVNYAALAYWFLFDSEAGRNLLMLKPAIDAVPALAVGAVLSLALILTEQYDLLFGAWMSLYGLAQVSYRQSLPVGIYLVGLCYIACGAYCLIAPGISFTNPWPMGIVFCLGEVAGGVILTRNTYSTEPPEQENSR